MAEIPIYQVQNRAPRSMPLPELGADSFGAATARGVQEVAGAVGDVAATIDQRKLEEQQAAASAAFAQFQAEQEKARAEAEQTAGPGAAGFRSALLGGFDNQAEALQAPFTDRRVANRMGGWIAQARANLDYQASVFEAKAGAEKQVTDHETARDTAVTSQMSTPNVASALLSVQTLADGWDSYNVPDKVKVAGRQADAAGVMTGLVTGLRQTGRAVEARDLLQSGKLDPFLAHDPRLRAELLDRTETQIRTDLSQAKAADDQALEAHRSLLDQTEATYRQGRRTADEWTALAAQREAAKQPEKAIAARGMAEEIAATEAYRGASQTERRAKIAELEAKPTLSATEGVTLRGLKSQAEDVGKMTTLGRAQYATGKAPEQIDLTDAGSVQRRVAALDAASAFGPVTGAFEPEELAPLQQMVAHGTTDQKIAAAGGIMRMGKYAGMALNQVAPANDVGFRAAVGLVDHPIGDQLMRLALKGAATPANEKKLLLTPPDGEDGRPATMTAPMLFSEITHDALAQLPPAQRAAIETNTMNLYLADGADHGGTAFNPGAYVRALRHALGGVSLGGDWAGGVTKWGDGWLALPMRMTAKSFQLRFARANDAAWKAASVSGGPPASAAVLRTLRPVLLREGIYGLMQGNTLIQAKGGGAYRFDVRKMSDGPMFQAGHEVAPPNDMGEALRTGAEFGAY